MQSRRTAALDSSTISAPELLPPLHPAARSMNAAEPMDRVGG
jgi:hypothetical protein